MQLIIASGRSQDQQQQRQQHRLQQRQRVEGAKPHNYR